MPDVLATNRCRPGSSRTVVDHEALRVTVLPVEVAYTSSRPTRSTALTPTLVISANSSEADEPPVWTSDTRREETGQVTAPSDAGARLVPAAKTTPPIDSTTTSAASAATRVRSTDLDLRAGAGETGRDGWLRCTSSRSPPDQPALTHRSPLHAGRSRRRYDVEPDRDRRRTRGPRQADRSRRSAPPLPADDSPDPRGRRHGARLRGAKAGCHVSQACPGQAQRAAANWSSRVHGRVPAVVPAAACPRGPPRAAVTRAHPRLPRRHRAGHRGRWRRPGLPELHGLALRLGAAGLAGLGPRAAAAGRLLRAAGELPARAARGHRAGHRVHHLPDPVRRSARNNAPVRPDDEPPECVVPHGTDQRRALRGGCGLVPTVPRPVESGSCGRRQGRRAAVLEQIGSDRRRSGSRASRGGACPRGRAGARLRVTRARRRVRRRSSAPAPRGRSR